MSTRQIYCEVCRQETEHQVETTDDGAVLALCRQCGRLSVPAVEPPPMPVVEPSPPPPSPLPPQHARVTPPQDGEPR